jgi:HlyD family secretion protein
MTLALPAPETARAEAAMRRWRASGGLALGFLASVVLVFGLGAWAAFATIAGAVVAPGRLEVESDRQVVQHLDGGVVKEILVRDGARVQAGDVLIRLDDSLLAAELAIIESQLFETLARVGRLEAEQEGADAIRFDAELLQVARERPEVAALVEGQRKLFEARNDTMARETEQLRERQTQIGEEIRGAEAQREALQIQLGFIDKELADQRALLAKGLTQQSRVLALERERARLAGQTGALTAQIAEARGRITEIDIQLTGREATRREEAITQLRDLKTTEAELKEKRLSARETLSRLEVRAPRAGEVLEMAVATPRAVVRPAEPILTIVPSESALVVEARIEVVSIDQVYPGQPARLRFSAFNQRTTPEIDGMVKRLSADALTDEQTGMSFYTAQIDIPPEGLAQLDGLTLVPGMPVEVYIQTGERTPLSYLMQPLTDFFSRGLREE